MSTAETLRDEPTYDGTVNSRSDYGSPSIFHHILFKREMKMLETWGNFNKENKETRKTERYSFEDFKKRHGKFPSLHFDRDTNST